MKRISLLLAALMLLTLFTGCTQPEQAAPPSQEDAAPPAEQESESPAPEENPTLKVLGFNAAFDANADINAQEIEKVTGYKVEYAMLPAENANEKLNIELSSGNRYDIVKISASQYYQLVGQGALLELDDLLAQYGQDLLSSVSENSWEACVYDGSTYALPMRKEYNKDVNQFIAYRKDVLDQVGAAVPTTLDEFYDALTKIKAARPDMIPLTGPLTADLGSGSDETVLSPTINSAFGIYNNWQDIDGALVPMLKHPNMKSLLSYMNRLYTEGLIDPDWAINTSTIIQEKFSGGHAAMVVSDRNVAVSMAPATKENNADAVIEYILPLIGPNGEQGANTEDKILYYSCVPKNSQYPEHAIRFMNEKAKWDNFLYLTLGIEQTHFTREEKADAPSGYEWIPIMPIFADDRNNSYWYLNTIDETNYPDMWMARVRKSDAMWEPFEKVSLACVDIAKPDPVGYMPPSENVSKYSQTLNKMANDFYVKVITGAESVDSYDAFLSEWDTAGGSAVTEEINAWYNR